ncbi:MAG TPA: alanine racemase [Candidatus Saccharimonadales bacterium]
MIRRQLKKLVDKATVNNYQTLNMIELSQSRLEHNAGLFKQLNPGIGIIPVLKSNAYGHGLIELAKMLNSVECDFIAVDGYFEAAKIRDITRHKILVLGYILPKNASFLDTKKCSFVVQDIAGLRSLASLKKKVKVHLELNTGMNRLGLALDEVDAYLSVIKNSPYLVLEGVMTHLADADNDKDDSFTAGQVTMFDEIVSDIQKLGLKPQYIHLAQTAGSTRANSKYANSMRIGIGLYGINPLSQYDEHYKDLENLQPILTMNSTVIKITQLAKGDRVSYNGIFTAPKNMKIAVLPLGYYEGVPRELSNVGTIAYQGNDLNIIGRVCMNHTMFDVSGHDITVGSVVTVISNDPKKNNSIDQIAKKYGIFKYTLMTNISDSTRRLIVK